MFFLSISFCILFRVIFAANIEFSTLLENLENSNIALNESFADKIMLSEELFVYDNMNLTNMRKEKIEFLFNNGNIHFHNISMTIIFDNFNFILNNTNAKICIFLENTSTLIIKVSFFRLKNSLFKKEFYN